MRVNHSIQFCCDSCTYRAHDEADLTNHKSVKHIQIFQCDSCSYHAIHRWDLNRHKNGMHKEINQTFSRFYNRSQNPREDNQPNKNPTEKLNDENRNNSTHKASKRGQSFQHKFSCSGSCDIRQKSFNHKDELELHMNFFHGATSPSQTQ